MGVRPVKLETDVIVLQFFWDYMQLHIIRQEPWYG